MMSNGQVLYVIFVGLVWTVAAFIMGVEMGDSGRFYAVNAPCALVDMEVYNNTAAAIEALRDGQDISTISLIDIRDWPE